MPADAHPCKLCDNLVDYRNWCDGCMAYICDTCDNRVVLAADHEPEAHGGGGPVNDPPEDENCHWEDE